MTSITLSVTTAPDTLTVSGVKSLGAPADIVATATPATGAAIALGTLSAQPDGPYTISTAVPPGNYAVQVTTSTTLSSDTKSSATVPAATLTATGNNTLGIPANIVVTATPSSGGSPITVATLSNQPVGPYSVTANVPPGDYDLDTQMNATLTSDATSSSTVLPATLTASGNNTLGTPANVVITATPTAGGSPITIATLVNQPVGAFSVIAPVPAGDYTVDTAMSATLTSDATSASTAAPTTLTSTGTNTLGFPANIVVTATPSSGSSPITIATLTNQPVGPFSVTAAVPPGDYLVDIEMCATLSCPTDVSVCVPQTPLTLTGVKSLGVPADLVFVATPALGGSPIPLGTLPNQPDGPYTFTAIVPPGSYAVDVSSSITLSAAATCSATVAAPTLTAVITYNGNNYQFNQTSGTNLGNYTDPQGRFVQCCISATNTALPGMTVFFRSDANGLRDEVVFEYGNLWVTTQPTNMAAYTATIAKGGITLATFSVPQHFWFSRWRWQSASRPVTTTPAALIASGLLPHYDASVLGKYTPTCAAQAYTPMTLAGLCGYMGMTGERGDLGPVTEWQADYICVGANLPTVLAQAEASGTFPWHFRDPKTGAPLNAITYPTMSTFVGGATNPLVKTTTCAIGTVSVIIDTAHEPALNYLPFLLTGDPYYLEGLQFQVTYDLIAPNPHYRYQTGQVRQISWRDRNLGQAAKITPPSVPSWLLPQSYFVTMLGKERDWLLADFVNNTAAPYPQFNTIEQNFGQNNVVPWTIGTFISPWQENFHATIVGWLVQMGFTDWLPILQWKIGFTIAMTNGTSGWPRDYGSLYHLGLRATSTSAWAANWGAAYAMNLAMNPSAFPPSDPTGNATLILTPSAESAPITYASYERGALAMANRLGIAAAAAPFAWVDAQLQAKICAGIYPDRKWCIT